MAYKMFDAEGVEIFNTDLQNKSAWCSHGASKEEIFIGIYGDKLNLIMNPEKENSPYVLDMFHSKRKMYADLKTQNTPWFMSQSKYNIDPNNALSFNVKDKNRYEGYMHEKGEIAIYFWVNWLPVMFTNNDDIAITVNPTNSVYGIKFSNLLKLAKDAPIHRYAQRREDDKGNGRESYVLNLKSKYFHKLA